MNESKLSQKDALDILTRTWGSWTVIGQHDTNRLTQEAEPGETLLATASRISGVFTADVIPFVPASYLVIRDRCARKELELCRGSK